RTAWSWSRQDVSWDIDYSTAQEPGPRGSPQVPQEPPDIGAAAPAGFPTPLTAKVEYSFSRSTLWQAGQAGRVFPKTSASKRRLHFRQTYSKRGMRDSSREPDGYGAESTRTPTPRRSPGPPGLRARRGGRSGRRRAPSGSAAPRRSPRR